MDDERLERALRAGPPNEPRYELALGSSAVARPQRRMLGALRLAGGAVAAVLVIAVVAWLRAGPSQPPDVGGDLLTDLRALGRIRIAVTNGSPQAEVPGVGYEGFDLDVARVIGDRLGLRVEIDLVDPAEIAAGHWAGRWDLAVDSAVMTEQRSILLQGGAPYYRREAAAIVRDDAGITTLTELDGSQVCVVPGSLAERWLKGSLQLVGGSAQPAPAAAVVTRPSVDDCLAAVQTGDADAFVADWQFELGAAPAGLTTLTDPPFVGLATPTVDRDRPGSGTLVAEVDRVLAQLRADGTLGSLSKRRFGGADLTTERGA